MAKASPDRPKFAKKYRKSMCDDLPALFENGEAVEEVCVQLGISRRAFYDWVDKYPEFAAAYEMGRLASDAWWLRLGRAGATGKVNVQPSLWIFNMKNRLGWRDKIEVDNDNDQTEPMHITFNVNDARGDVKVTRGTDS